MLPPSGIVLAAVSGGADSMCLLTALCKISAIRKFDVEAVHYNHMLRGEESDRDEAFVTAACKAMGITCHIGRGDVKVEAEKRRCGIEETARIMRYSFFYKTARKIGASDHNVGASDCEIGALEHEAGETENKNHITEALNCGAGREKQKNGASDHKNAVVKIATAHTADDNAETMIMNLARGAGTSGLAGIPPVRGAIIRPMLRVSRDEVIGFLKSMDVKYVDDSSNSLMLYTRNRIRSMVIPVLKEINPAFTDATSTAAMLCRDDDEYLSKLADEFLISQEKCDQANAANRKNAANQANAVNQVHKTNKARHVNTNAVNAVNTINAVKTTGDLNTVRTLEMGKTANTINSANEINKINTVNTVNTVNITALLALPAAISGRVVRKLYGGALSFSHVRAVLELCSSDDPSARLSLPGMTVHRQYNEIVFEKNKTQHSCESCEHSASHIDEQAAEHSASHDASHAARYSDDFGIIPLEAGTTTMISKAGFKVTCNSVIYDDTINKSLTTFVFKNDDLCGTIAVRSRREADSIRLLGRVGTKTLKKLFIEKRIPARMRDAIPLIADDLGVLAICGIGRGDRAVPQPGEHALEIIFERIQDNL